MTVTISCPICNHPDRLEIDHDLETRSPRSVAMHWHLDIEAMALHKMHKDRLSPFEEFIREDSKKLLREAKYEDGSGGMIVL